MNLREEYIKTYRNAGSFCNWTYINYFFRDDFEDKFKDVTKHLSGESKDIYKWIFLRALAVNLITKNSLYFDHELNDQKRFTEFNKLNSNKNEVAEFKFTGDYNLHAFIDLHLTDEDKEHMKNKDIIDAGAFTGDTTLPLSKLTNQNVYAFEPFEESFKLLNKNIADNNIKNIIPINKSLGNINGERTLYLSGTNVQGITSNPDTRPYDNEIKVEETTIDTFVEENNLDVGYITIDVEGAERDLLKGAINTIKTQKPILSISIYHSVHDYFEIIPWVANLELGYEFEVLKEQPWPFLGDTIVQCRAK
ncbi:MAG: FkbM family methyltransferase [Methanobrevibacter sp.]|nr:FkbM family methyltransferase [Methanobrevibacter sp.]